jgi:putative transposase
VNGVRGRAPLEESAHDILGLCCLHNQTKGKEPEQIQEIVAHDLALRGSHRVSVKYRYRVMQGNFKEEVESCVREQTRQMNCEVQELNVQSDPVHLIGPIPPKLSISDYMGRLKDKSAIRVFSAFRDLRQRRYWGHHFWAQGYCVGGRRDDTEVCKVEGKAVKAGTKTGGVPIQQIDKIRRQRVWPAPFGGRALAS